MKTFLVKASQRYGVAVFRENVARCTWGGDFRTDIRINAKIIFRLAFIIFLWQSMLISGGREAYKVYGTDAPNTRNQASNSEHGSSISSHSTVCESSRLPVSVAFLLSVRTSFDRWKTLDSLLSKV